MILGVDLGGTSIKGGLVQDKNIIKYYKKATDISNSPQSIFCAMFEVIDYLLAFEKVEKIGVSSAGDINPITGEVIYATNVLPGYKGQNIKQILQDRYNLPVEVMNDAMCALIGEMHCGAGVGYKDIIMLTLGTGVGGEIALDGKIVLGEDFRGSRLGHNQFAREFRVCPCGKNSCIETFISANGLIATAKKHGLDISDCNQIFEKGVLTSTKDIIISEFTQDLANIVDDLCTIYKVEIVIIGGGLINMSQYWWQLFLSKISTTTMVKKAKLGNDAGIIGASVIAQNKSY